MSKLPLLLEVARSLIKVTRWLDDNFERLMRELHAECPRLSVAALADQIIDAAFGSVLA
jgi:hypothetical protein